MSVLEKFRLGGKVAVVTGATRGIGRSLARALGEAGASVAVTGRVEYDAVRAAGELRAAGIASLGVELDVRQANSCDAAASHVEAELGTIEILVNNAGVSVGAAALDTTPETSRTVMDTNLDGVWNMSRAVAPQMISRSTGVMVNIGSMSAFIVNQPRWQAPYLASKAAVHQLTKALAAEWAPHGIRVNALAPGYILT